jgi:hypothetical protein
VIDAPLLAEGMMIIGRDTHKAYPPMPPAPVPHFVSWALGGIRSPNTSRAALPIIPPNHPMVLTPGGAVVGRGHDAAPMIPHVPMGGGPLLVPAVMAASSSKCEFGVGSVKVASGPVAVGALKIIGLQLHCQDPIPPLPTGTVVCVVNSTVVADFTVVDALASLYAMVMDIAVQFLINQLTSAIASVIEEVAFDLLFPLAPEAVALIGIFGGPVIDSLLSVGIGDLLGGPMGWAPSWSLYTKATDPSKNPWHVQLFPTSDDFFGVAEGQPSWFGP